MRKDQEYKCNHSIEYVVGCEKSLREIIREDEMMPLLKGAVRAGAAAVKIVDSEGGILWEYVDTLNKGVFSEKLPLHLEGEIAGHIVIKGEKETNLKGLSELLLYTVKIVMNNNLKRMLTAEIHTTVVNQSYEELLETNRRLKISEKKYRELAGSLEKKVQERTEELKMANVKLIQQEKMASIGQLAAGVAHEINNPMGFISSNIGTFRSYAESLVEFINAQSEIIESFNPTDAIEGLKEKRERLKLDYILEDIKELIKESLEGADRVKKIVSGLKGFSHIDEGDKAIIDINEEIERTLHVLTHEIPEDAEIIRDFHSLPGFTCNPAVLCQVFLNIILNSIQARKKGLKFVIRTGCEDEIIRITFSDNGPGIPKEIRNRIFEPFFTTKEIGKGTGMGLTVVYEVIDAYSGSIDVESQPGKGTTFNIVLPLGKNAKIR